MALSSEEKKKIYEEEKARKEARDQLEREASIKNGKSVGSCYIGCLAFVVVVALLLWMGNFGSNKPKSDSAVKQLTTQSTQLSLEDQEKQAQNDAATQLALSKPHFEDGSFIVGSDIQPGTYRTRIAEPNCYYERLSGFSGTTNEIISNNLTSSHAIVTILATDKGFSSKSCGMWTQDLSAVNSDPSTFGDGMFIVGTDLQPGTFKSEGGGSCYYERLSGFGGTTNEIISNSLTDSPAIVTISATDKGFSSKSCGMWIKTK